MFGVAEFSVFRVGGSSSFLSIFEGLTKLLLDSVADGSSFLLVVACSGTVYFFDDPTG